MDRRTFVRVALAGVVAVPPPLHGQAAKVWRVGVLEAVPASRNAANLEALRTGLRERGYLEGRNLVIEYRSSDGREERFPDLAAGLVRLGVDVIVARGTPATNAAREATRTIPVVMATMGRPPPIIASLDRPGANVTGVTTFSTELTRKRIELLRELVPTLSRIGMLSNMGNPAVPAEWDETRAAAAALGLAAELLDVRGERDLDPALERARGQRVGALVVGADGVTRVLLPEIVAAAARHRLPAIYPAREFVEAGGLVAYGISYPDLYLRIADYVDRIARGADPAVLPVEQPSRFELVVNAATAKALAIDVPRALLLRADAVIR